MNIKEFRKNKIKSRVIYYILIALVVICIPVEISIGNYFNAFLCILTLILFSIPSFIEEKFNIILPNTLEISIYLFIFASEILGEIANFYIIVPHWDTILHIFNGFLCTGIGYALFDLLNTKSTKIYLSSLYIIIFAFCFSMTIGVLWEFFEYSVDNVLTRDMQKDYIVDKISSVKLDEEKKNVPVVIDNIEKTIIVYDEGEIVIENGYLDIGLNDTIKDLFVNFVGIVIFCIFETIYINIKHDDSFTSRFIPIKQDS